MRRIALAVSFFAVAQLATAAPPPASTDALESGAAAVDEGASPTLKRAVKLYEKGDFTSASIELQKVMSGESKDSKAGKQTAEFFLGKTFYRMKYYAGALAKFDAIVEAGPTHAYHAPTLKWLAALSRVLPETSGILEKIGKYNETAIDDPSLAQSRDEIYYLLGRHHYSRGEADFGKAIGYFQRVDANNENYIKAKFFEGVTNVRKYDAKAAAAAFKEVLRIGRDRPKQYKPSDIVTYNELAMLQMARVFYSTQDFKKSIKYYEWLEQDSPDWTASLFESSWAYFQIQNNSKALGNIHSLNAPYFEDEFFPESLQLKAVIYFNYCMYDRALEAINEYDAKYGPLTKNLGDLLAKYEDDAEFYEYVKQVIAKKSGIDRQTELLVLSVLQDRTLKKEFDWVQELDRELTQLSNSDKAWQTTQVAADLNAELTVQKSLADGQAGKVARSRVKRLYDELGVLKRDGVKVKFEILNGMSEKVANEALAKERVSADHKEEAIVIDDEHFKWKFNGEYWKDELGYYRFKIASKCPKK